MFTVAERDAVRDRVLELAAADPRVVAGAVVGSLALGDGDRWSDLDLTFAVAGDALVADVLGDWTERIAADLNATPLFDLPSGPTIYGSSSSPAASSSTSRSRPRPSSRPRGRGSGCSSGARASRRHVRLGPRSRYSATPFTTPSARTSASSADARGRRSTGSAASGTRRSRSGAGGAGSQRQRAAASTISPTRCWRASMTRSSGPSTRPSFAERSGPRSTRSWPEADEVGDLAVAVEPRLRELLA